ncbi:MAG: hypothetical protein ACLGGX_04825 [Bdellovibrionia bacterium]
MAFEELQEKLKADLQQTLDRVQESAWFNQLRDRYDNLTPTAQRGALAGGAALVVAIVLSIPYSYYSQSALQEEEFLQKRETLRSLLKVTREAQDVPQIPAPPDANSLRSLIESRLNAAQLLPEQILGVTTVEANSKLIPNALVDAAIQVNLSKINLKQANDIAYNLQAINASVKMTDLTFKPSAGDPRYFDISLKMISLKVPEVAPVLPLPEMPGVGQ